MSTMCYLANITLRQRQSRGTEGKNSLLLRHLDRHLCASIIAQTLSELIHIYTKYHCTYIVVAS